MPLDRERQTELSELLWARCDGEATAEQTERLEALLKSDIECRRYFVRYVHLHGSLSWDRAGADRAALVAAEEESRVMPARAPVAAITPRGARWYAPIVTLANRPVVFSMVFATSFLLAGLTLLAIIRLTDSTAAPSRGTASPVFVAQVSAADECVWKASEQPVGYGSHLTAGQRLRLVSGLAQITFRDGTQVLLAGPSEFRVVSRHAGRLDRGQVYAQVPPAAQGFTITTPTAVVVDLGTEFGVSVEADGATEVHVFQGKVITRHFDATDDDAPLQLTAQQAARITPDKIRTLAARPERFVLTMPTVERLPVASTGVGRFPGDLDPHWEIVELSSDPAFQPQPAIVMEPHPNYRSVLVSHAQWISLAADPADLPAGQYTFRTHFDLTDFVAETARLELELLADNGVSEIRLNGQSQPLPSPEVWTQTLTEWGRVEITDGFLPGRNELLVIVNNEAGNPTPMGLVVALRGWGKRAASNHLEGKSQPNLSQKENTTHHRSTQE